MSKKYRVAFLILLALGVGLLSALFLSNQTIVVLEPKGLIAAKQFQLMNIAGMLSLIVIIPVFILTFAIAWKYRESNTKAKHTPDWDHDTLLESIWWGIPCAIILVLAVITWNSSHELDPYKAIKSNKKPLTVQVVALQWKWLFIYPEQHIATVNFVQFPQKTPINFQITADAPMNSFWIPQLGGQVYAMSGMKTKLHLIADEVGSYRGSSANISGRGFAGMTFTAKSSSWADFEKWVKSAQQSSKRLSLDEYNTLAKPSENNPVALYSSHEQGLYDTILMKFMAPGHHKAATDSMAPANTYPMERL